MENFGPWADQLARRLVAHSDEPITAHGNRGVLGAPYAGVGHDEIGEGGHGLILDTALADVDRVALQRAVGETSSMFIDPVPEHAATGALAEYYQKQQEAWGFLPNYAGAFSTRPDVAVAWNTLNAAIRDGMDRRRFELATIAAARALRSTYCTAAHSKFMRDVCGDEQVLFSIAEEPTGATLSLEDREVYEFAAKVAASAESVDENDINRLRDVGLSDADVADVVFAAAARSFFTRVLDGLGARLDSQTAASFSSDLLESMLVGRPAAVPDP